MKYRWHIAPAEPLWVERLTRELGVAPLVAQCLINRGQGEPARAARFLQPRLSQLQDPLLIPGMGEAVSRLWAAREQGELVVIFGDYDVDGVSATALLQLFLSRHGWTVRTYLPHRLEEGYGLTAEAVRNCLAQHPSRLVLAVDCGTTAVEIIAGLREEGVEVIVLDHHQGGGARPPAVALVNPWCGAASGAGGEGADFTELCSVGLAFKLAHALTREGRRQQVAEFMGTDLRPYLDLVALGTVADLVPLVGENRILVAAGLKHLDATRRAGLQALKTVAQVKEPVRVRDIGFVLGPRVNAAGRLESAEEALRLLLAETLEEAEPLAASLDRRNRERQSLEKQMLGTLLEKLQATFQPEQDYVIVAGHPDYHIGVVGIVAARVLQTFYRPTIILGGDGPLLRGSGRSIEGFDLAAALQECHDLLERHGGHKMAAGVSLRPENLEAFRARLNEVARRQLRAEQLQPPLRLDAVAGLGELTVELVGALERLGPFGQQNPPVQLCVTGLSNQRAPARMGSAQQHLKLWVTDGRFTGEAVWWNGAEKAWPVGTFELAVWPQLNRYNGHTSVQLTVLDWRPA
ncbi:MAG: single-stranded-DNA-specific exonuclease RecJ [Verrucomicrobiae bacterium]|nr:single-stranded-DNA-specific exonuclease RecJ [Verrucomicrobiae bacterium]